MVGFERSAYVTDLRALQVEIAELKADVGTLPAGQQPVGPRAFAQAGRTQEGTDLEWGVLLHGCLLRTEPNRWQA